MTNGQMERVSLELTHVLYDPSSNFSFGLALITLSPILLMPAYAALAVQTRELVIINMWAGQLACECFSWIIKRAVKEDRPSNSVGNGYGFPSSHSQYMGYFSTFLILHIYFRHRFAPRRLWIIDHVLRTTISLALLAWAGIVSYSRYHLAYHSQSQVLWGLGIGVAFAALYYGTLELLPARRPQSLVGKTRRMILDNPVAHWMRLRDGWAVWEDGGEEKEWERWYIEWKKTLINMKKKRT